MPKQPAPQATTMWQGTKPLSVIILDDERFDRHRLARLCSGLPMPCEVTNALTLDGFNALLEEQIYDLILVDYALPDGTGLQALEAVRCSVRNFGSATLMITGQADSAVEQAALKAGCADYLTKDKLTRQSFHNAVRNALKRAALSLEVETQTFSRKQVETVLETFASRCAADIKPLVSRSLRLVRDLRADPDPARIIALEQSSLSIWEALIAQERHSGAEMIRQIFKEAPQQIPQQMPVRKPPSPFTRLRP